LPVSFKWFVIVSYRKLKQTFVPPNLAACHSVNTATERNFLIPLPSNTTYPLNTTYSLSTVDNQIAVNNNNSNNNNNNNNYNYNT